MTAAAPPTRIAPHCPTSVANDLAGLGDTRQLITVTAARATATTASLQLWTRVTGGCFHAAGAPESAVIGRSGVSTHHVEGDGSTPAGVFGFDPVMYGIDANPGVRFAYHRLVCGDWWDEDPSSPAYNRFVHVPCGTTPAFGATSEALWQIAPFYDWMAVIDYNTSPVVAGRGSGIFLHVATGVPTAGCVSLPPKDLVSALRWLEPADHPRIAIGTAGQLAAL